MPLVCASDREAVETVELEDDVFLVRIGREEDLSWAVASVVFPWLLLNGGDTIFSNLSLSSSYVLSDFREQLLETLIPNDEVLEAHPGWERFCRATSLRDDETSSL